MTKKASNIPVGNRGWGLLTDDLPEAAASFGALVAGIVGPFFLILLRHGGSTLSIFNILPNMNTAGHLAEVLLVFLPFGFVYSWLIIFYSYQIKRRYDDISFAIYFPLCLVPWIVMAFGEFNIFWFYAAKTGTLTPVDYNDLKCYLTSAVAGLFLLDIFISFVRIRKRLGPTTAKGKR